jgi:hypothetical protein
MELASLDARGDGATKDAPEGPNATKLCLVKKESSQWHAQRRGSRAWDWTPKSPFRYDYSAMIILPALPCSDRCRQRLNRSQWFNAVGPVRRPSGALQVTSLKCCRNNRRSHDPVQTQTQTQTPRERAATLAWAAVGIDGEADGFFFFTPGTQHAYSTV